MKRYALFAVIVAAVAAGIANAWWAGGHESIAEAAGLGGVTERPGEPHVFRSELAARPRQMCPGATCGGLLARWPVCQ